MTAILERRESTSLWGRFCNWITSTENRVQHGCASRLVRLAALPAALHDYVAGLPLRRLSPPAGQRALRLTATAVVDEVLFPTTNEPAYMTTFC